MAEKLKNETGAKAGKEDMESNSAEKPSRSGHNKARRGLLKAGIVGVPLILTLKGRSAWANGTTQAGSLSSQAALGTQNTPAKPQTPPNPIVDFNKKV